MNIQMKIVTVIFTCKFTVVALKLTWRVRLLIWWLTIWVVSIRFYCIRGFREAGLWLLLLLKLQGSVLSASHVSVSRRRRNSVWLSVNQVCRSGANHQSVTLWIRLEACCAHRVYPLPPPNPNDLLHTEQCCQFRRRYAATQVPGVPARRRTGNGQADAVTFHRSRTWVWHRQAVTM